MSDFNRYVTTNPGTKITRSRFDMSHRHLTTLNAGSLYPIARWEVLPSDTFTIDLSIVARMQTPIHPVMDNCYLDVFFFFVPNRLVWEHWKEFMGESTDGFLQDTEYEEPHIIFGDPVPKGSIYDHFEIPQGYVSADDSLGPSDLPIRSYGLIWNEWFRDQNVSPELFIDKSDSNTILSTIRVSDNDLGDLTYGILGDQESWFSEGQRLADSLGYTMVNSWKHGRPLPVAKYHDLFTSALPLPQRGPAVALPLSAIYNDGLPVLTKESLVPLNYNEDGFIDSSYLKVNSPSDVADAYGTYNLSMMYGEVGFTSGSTGTGNYTEGIFPTNLWADASTASISIEVFRQAYAMQRLFEREARSGSRYTELIRSAFGVTSPDARQQRPELIGLRRIPITMAQVVQNSATDETSPQGNTAAYSLTSDKSSYCTYSSTEHGNIIALACIRTDHTYQQGLSKDWTRRRRFDYYDPVFANLGEQPIKVSELYAFGTKEEQNAVFGYQEAWYEYRNKTSKITGELSSLYAQSLDVWHYGDEFMSAPTLSPEFIYETRENLDRTLAVDSNTADQFLADFYFGTVVTRPLPLYSVPGLSGHF